MAKGKKTTKTAPKAEKKAPELKKVEDATASAESTIVYDEVPPNEGGIAVELPTEEGKDHLPLEKEELPLKDKVLTSKEELPKDKVDIDLFAEGATYTPPAKGGKEKKKTSSPYDEDIEKIQPAAKTSDESDVWVADPALLRKVKGYKDTLNGTLYRGILK